MKQEEWLAEFERVHGRPANQEEIQQVFGQFESPETQATQDTPVSYTHLDVYKRQGQPHSLYWTDNWLDSHGGHLCFYRFQYDG